jgi:hypothetical protein
VLLVLLERSYSDLDVDRVQDIRDVERRKQKTQQKANKTSVPSCIVMPSPDPSHPLLSNSPIPDIQSYQTAPHYKSEKGSLINMLRYRPPHATQLVPFSSSGPLSLLFLKDTQP